MNNIKINNISSLELSFISGGNCEVICANRVIKTTNSSNCYSCYDELSKAYYDLNPPMPIDYCFTRFHSEDCVNKNDINAANIILGASIASVIIRKLWSSCKNDYLPL